MTVNNTTAGVLRYGNGVTQEFDFPFEAQDASHVRVAQVLGTAAVDLSPLNYSVSLVPPGGMVTLNYIPDNTVTLYIYRKTPRDQLVSVSSQSRYDPEVTETVWDKLTLAAQEMQAEINLAVKTVPGQDPQALLTAIALSEQNAAAAASAAASDAAAALAAAAAADADAAQAAADRVQTGLDRAQTGLDRAQTTADAAATAADRAQTAADRVQTGLDRAATAADRAQTTLDRAATAADRVQTGLDAAATAADRVQTGLDRAAAAASAAEAAAYVPTIATQAEAEAGTNNTKLMTPLRSRQADEAFRNANALGWGQTWQNVTGSRSASTSYQNTTGRPIAVAIHTNGVAGNHALEVSTNNSSWLVVSQSGSASALISTNRAIVPPGYYYRYTGNIAGWMELR